MAWTNSSADYGLPAIGSKERLSRSLHSVDDLGLAWTSRQPVLAGTAHASLGRRSFLDKTELENHITSLRKEIDMKDNMISQLSRTERPWSPTMHMRSSYSAEKNDLFERQQQYDRAEILTLNSKIDRLQNELRDAQQKSSMKDATIKDLQIEIDTYKEGNSRQAALIQSLQQRVKSAESRSDFESVSLHRNYKDLEDKCMQLETHLRHVTSEKEDVLQRCLSAEQKYNDIRRQVSSIVQIDDVGLDPLQKLSNLVQENLMLRGKVEKLTDLVQSTEIQSKASQETINRLMSEINREQKSTYSTVTAMDMLKKDRDEALIARTELEKELEYMKSRLESSAQAWTVTREELHSRHSTLAQMQQDLKSSQYKARAAETELKNFKESLAVLLSHRNSECSSTEDTIKHRVREMSMSHSQTASQIDELELKVKTIGDQLSNQCELYESAQKRCRRAEHELTELREKLRDTEGELAAKDVVKDTLRGEKTRYVTFLRKLAQVMQADQLTEELGVELNGEALLARAEQLSKLEGPAISDKSSHVYNLQRKVRVLKQQLDSKELQVELLRKKLSAAQKDSVDKVEAEKESSELLDRYRKAQRQIQRYQKQLGELKSQITEMKVDVGDSNTWKIRYLEKEKEIDELTKRCHQLQQVRGRQANKIADLKTKVDMGHMEAQEHETVTVHTVNALTAELRSTKAALEEVARREKQLVEFRESVARVIGLNVHSLATPDYDILARLEKVMQRYYAYQASSGGLAAPHHGVSSGWTTDDTEPFTRGYTRAKRLVNLATSSRRPRSHSPGRYGKRY